MQENAARMQKQKAVFDRKLQEQEEKNREVVKENAKIAQNIMKLAALGVRSVGNSTTLFTHGVKWVVFYNVKCTRGYICF